MKLLAPAYYKNFKCIADKCKHSCCIGWEIDIDDDTLDLYADIEEPYGEVIRSSVDFDDVPHFRLTDGERCPHLDSSGLCKIITEFGEDHLCDICNDHPRFYEDTARGKIVGLGMSCEEACRLILTSDDYRIVDLDELDEQNGDAATYDYLKDIESIYGILSNDAISLYKKMDRIHENLNINTDYLSREYWLKNLKKLEFLNENNRALFEDLDIAPNIPNELEKPLERAFAYFLFRHCSGVKEKEEFINAIRFSCICTYLIASIVKHQSIADINGFMETARSVSEEIEYSETNTEILKSFYDFTHTDF